MNFDQRSIGASIDVDQMRLNCFNNYLFRRSSLPKEEEGYLAIRRKMGQTCKGKYAYFGISSISCIAEAFQALGYSRTPIKGESD